MNKHYKSLLKKFNTGSPVEVTHAMVSREEFQAVQEVIKGLVDADEVLLDLVFTNSMDYVLDEGIDKYQSSISSLVGASDE